ncbi:MAG TPA: hypothetical protein VM658_16420 [bacterium]|nr:hypothetical protein [bacterium]
MKRREKTGVKGADDSKKGSSRRDFLRQTGTAMLVTNSYMVISVFTGRKAQAGMCDAGCTSACVQSCTSSTVVEPPPCSSCTSCTSSCTADCTKWCTSGCCISCTQSTQ